MLFSRKRKSDSHFEIRAVVVVAWLLSHVLFATPWTVARQAPLSMGFPRQEYWSGVLFPSPGNLLDPGMKLMSPVLQVVSGIASRFFTAELPGKPLK